LVCDYNQCTCVRSLQRLILSNTKVTDVGMAALTALKNLQELVLNRTAVTDTGAAFIGGQLTFLLITLMQFAPSSALHICTCMCRIRVVVRDKINELLF